MGRFGLAGGKPVPKANHHSRLVIKERERPVSKSHMKHNANHKPGKVRARKVARWGVAACGV
jgi:hypothetical protein